MPEHMPPGLVVELLEGCGLIAGPRVLADGDDVEAQGVGKVGDVALVGLNNLVATAVPVALGLLELCLDPGLAAGQPAGQ